MAFFSCQLNDTVCRVGAWVGCKRFFAGCGGPEKTPGHQRVKESEAEGYIVIPKTLSTPTSLSVPPLPAAPHASAFSKLWLRVANLEVFLRSCVSIAVCTTKILCTTSVIRGVRVG